eukprot:gene16468-22690_t
MWEDVKGLGAFSEEISRFKEQKPIQVAAAAAAAAKTPEARATRGRAKLDEEKHKNEDKNKNAEEKHKKEAKPPPSLASPGAGQGHGQRKFTESPEWCMGGKLHPYQLEGLNWVYHKWKSGESVILADEMGLGKTIQTIAYIGALYQECVVLPMLVVVPLSTLRNWEREFALWAPYLNVVNLIGNAEARKVILDNELYAPVDKEQTKDKDASRSKQLQDDSRKEIVDNDWYAPLTRANQDTTLQVKAHFSGTTARVKFDVLLTSYELLLAEAGPLSKIQYETMVVDEGHRLKNKESRLFQELKQFKVHHKLLLTSTPLQNNMTELVNHKLLLTGTASADNMKACLCSSISFFLDDSKFSSLEEFELTFKDLGQRDSGQAHGLLSPTSLPPPQERCTEGMPPKEEQIVMVELSTIQRHFYRSLLAKRPLPPVLAA